MMRSEKEIRKALEYSIKCDKGDMRCHECPLAPICCDLTAILKWVLEEEE